MNRDIITLSGFIIIIMLIYTNIIIYMNTSLKNSIIEDTKRLKAEIILLKNNK